MPQRTEPALSEAWAILSMQTVSGFPKRTVIPRQFGWRLTEIQPVRPAMPLDMAKLWQAKAERERGWRTVRSTPRRSGTMYLGASDRRPGQKAARNWSGQVATGRGKVAERKGHSPFATCNAQTP